MNHHYLWDRSGDADREVERLERLLRDYRYQPGHDCPALISLVHRPPRLWMQLIAAAAAIVICALILWVFRGPHTRVENPPLAINSESATKEKKRVQEENRPRAHRVIKSARSGRKLVGKNPNRHAPNRPDRFDPSRAGLMAERRPNFIPFLDVVTAHHLEQAHLLLRSFRNTRDSDLEPDGELAYEKRRSRDLLYKNILLRRTAEAKGNLPVEELLGSLEPFLLDIANLPDRPSSDEVLSIKDQMKKREIVPVLQIYSTATLNQVF
jgi:hypothetical protein